MSSLRGFGQFVLSIMKPRDGGRLPFSYGRFSRVEPRTLSRANLVWRLAIVMLVFSASTAKAEGLVQPVLQVDAVPPETFAYPAPQETTYLRGLLELSGILTGGLLWYITSTQIRRNYDLKYRWSMFRSKLAGEAFELDTNHFGTNFIGHPIGGTMYYIVARGNRLGIAESFGLAVGGSLLWEYFGEVSEVVSVNDMIVTPLAGLALGEAWTQLGAFFDRSGPGFGHSILGSFFAPFKSLNDWFDGVSPQRAQSLDEYGFPRDEWHAFDLHLAFATNYEQPESPTVRWYPTRELRLSLGSRLARLPGYDGVTDSNLLFDDANMSSITLEGAMTQAGLVDFRLETEVVLLGHYYRHTTTGPGGALWGGGTLIGIACAYEYTVHDFNRDRSRSLDRIASVQPLGFVFEGHGALGHSRLLARLQAGLRFGGVTPYALQSYMETLNPGGSATEVPPLVANRGYNFALGGRLSATLGARFGGLDTQADVRFDDYTEVGSPTDISDQRLTMSVRTGTTIPNTPLWLAAFGERRSRAGDLNQVHAGRSELTAGIEAGAHY